MDNTKSEGTIMPKTNGTPLIAVKQLSKQFRVAQRGEGLKGTPGYLFSRKYRRVDAVTDVSFEIAHGTGD
jgi:ABC-2 type transport system ATP-binding protein